ncbi:MAG: DUF3800 domain-containing protein [Pirellulaceae bacterium]
MTKQQFVQQLTESLTEITGAADLREAALSLFSAIGYTSARQIALGGVDAFREQFETDTPLNAEQACLDEWRDIQFLFQLTGEEVAEGTNQGLLFDEEQQLDKKEVKSYLFFAIDLRGNYYSRTALSSITRSLNRVIKIPVLILFRHGSTVTLAVINRRKNLRDTARHVLTRVSLIKDISTATPHRAHLDILWKFSLFGINAEAGAAIRNFRMLDDAWQKTLNTRELNERFYRELVNWYYWATSEIQLPVRADHLSDDDDGRRRNVQNFILRLLSRTVFCWFLKERGLIARELLEMYDTTDQRRCLTNDADAPGYAEDNHYYRGILQNIFFSSLNHPMNHPHGRRLPTRRARNDRTTDDPELQRMAYLGKNYLPTDFDYALFDRVPYLNGGLFDALREDNASDTIEDPTIHIPNKLFYAKQDDGYTVGSGRNAKTVEGLNRILDKYKFTIDENTALDEEVALDPELLGHVFENLLAEVDPNLSEEEKKNVRRASGSFYTPRRIVDYMVNESLLLHLETTFRRDGADRRDIELLYNLVYSDDPDIDYSGIADRIVQALDTIKILDPACGSGAFPMGMLSRIVQLLRKADPDNSRWLVLQLAKADNVDAVRAVLAHHGDDYSRKLGVIQNAIYGVDLQPLAALITKLRFFISLLVEQNINLDDPSHNYGITPLPNLETKVICADSLQDAAPELARPGIFDEVSTARAEYYRPDVTAARRDELADEIAEKLSELYPQFAERVTGTRYPDQATQQQRNREYLKEWFRHSTLPAPFFNFEVFFPELRESGFDIVLGNPPYGGTKISDAVKNALGLGWNDPYGAFIARFLGNGVGENRRHTALKPDGVLCMIVSDTFMTIKSHLPLRKQMLQNRIHKMLRVHRETFKATVNTAIIVCQRGQDDAATHMCQMADLTNINIHDEYERFLKILYKTEGFASRANLSNKTYAIYYYPQSLIATNSNRPFFVAAPKLFALMQDEGNVSTQAADNEPAIVYSVRLNGRVLRIFRLGDEYQRTGRQKRWQNHGLFKIVSGLKTGNNAEYLRITSPDAQKNFPLIDPAEVLSQEEIEGLSADEKRNGIRGAKHFVPFEMGQPSDATGGLLACYYQPPSLIAIDWSRDAVAAMRAEAHSDLANEEFRFLDYSRQISFSFTGQYAPTFRQASAPVFLNAASRIVLRDDMSSDVWLGFLNSRLSRFLTKAFINHSVNFGVDDVKALPCCMAGEALRPLVRRIVQRQEADPSYDYSSNEQCEIDGIVYATYQLDSDDVREVENWYARRYPPLYEAQRRRQPAVEVERTLVNFYCDESCHLPHDQVDIMLLGMVACPEDKKAEVNDAVRQLKIDHGIPASREIKWNNVSPAHQDFYLAVLELFFSYPELQFRCLLARNKQQLFQRHRQTGHDDFYYRMYFDLLRGPIEDENRYHIYLDMKDTRGREKERQLREMIQRNQDDFDGNVVEQVQSVHSHEVRLIQLADLLMGAIAYLNRGLTTSTAKVAMVRKLQELTGFDLTQSTPPHSEKVTLLEWFDEGGLELE